MNQLERRFYSRSEIAEEMNLNIADNRHFKRNLEAKLNKYGYTYEYTRKGVSITEIPQTKEDRLKEIFLREYNLKIKDYYYSFVCFLYLFIKDDDFSTMPWRLRQEKIKYLTGETIPLTTLQRWTNKLIEEGLFILFEDYYCYWYTKETKEEEIIKKVETETEIFLKNHYFFVKKKLLNSGLSSSEVMKELWYRFHAIYYRKNEIHYDLFANNAILIKNLVIEAVERS